jgi:transposase-like protein
MSSRKLLESAGKAWRAASVDLQEPGIRLVARDVSDKCAGMDDLIQLVKQSETSPHR